MKLNKLVGLFLFLVCSSAFAGKKKILFLDLNHSQTEINIAKEMAKKRNEELIVYPKNNEYFEQSELDEILAKNKFQSLVLSGHDGGSTFEGENGRLSVVELISSLEKSKNTEIKSLYLLGCNSANKSKLFFWKTALPKLKFIAGYDGTAPLSKVKAGLNYFRDTLQNEDKLIKTKTKEELKDSLSKIQDINHLNTSLYVDCGEENPQEYSYFGKRKENEKFSELTTKECIDKIKEYKSDYSDKILKYWSGELEPTMENTKSGFMRKAYTFMRQNEHCFNLQGKDELVSGFSGDSLLFLLFNKDFNHNFSEYYHSLIEDSLKEVEITLSNPDKMADKILADYRKRQQSYNKVIQNYESFEIKSKKEQEKLDDEIKNLMSSNPGFLGCLANRTRECTNQYHDLETKINAKRLSLNLLKTMDKDNLSLMSSLLSGITKEDIMRDIEDAKVNITQSKEILTKMLLNPSEVTRKEIMDLSHNFNIPGLQNKSLSGLKSALSAAEQLSDSFPFSWHEKKPNEEVPHPDKRFRVESLKKIEVDLPEDKDLANLLKAMLDI